MNTTQKKRLLKLADFLRNKVKPSKFDLHVILASTKKDDEYESVEINPMKELAPTEGFCGTVGCAIGHCPIVFPRQAQYSQGFIGWGVIGKGDKSDLEDFEWAEDFFGLDEVQAGFLFDPASYPEGRRGKNSVANRINYFVRSNGKIKAYKDLNNTWELYETHEGLKG